jgi:hypothetical protein
MFGLGFLFSKECKMRFYSQMARHPFAGWFSVGGVVIGRHRVSVALTRHMAKFVRDDAKSWAVFLLGVRLHVVSA